MFVDSDVNDDVDNGDDDDDNTVFQSEGFSGFTNFT